jgi:hypothetical protein
MVEPPARAGQPGADGADGETPGCPMTTKRKLELIV